MSIPLAEQRIRPSRLGYFIALAILIAGVVPSVFLLTSGIGALTEGLIRAGGPGQITVELDKPGTWTVFYEYRVADGPVTYVTSPDPPPLGITLTSESGDIQEMSPSNAQFDYSTGTRSGTSIGRFVVDEPGSYEIAVDYAGDDPEQIFVALGHEKGKATLKTVFGVIGIVISGAIAFIIFLVVLILRSRSKNRMQQAALGQQQS